jgi:hypothetical protein
MLRLVRLIVVLSLAVALVGVRPANADSTVSVNLWTAKGSAERVADYRFSIGHCGRSYVVHMWIRVRDVTSTSMYVVRVRVAIATYNSPVVSAAVGVYGSTTSWAYPSGNYYGRRIGMNSGENVANDVNRRFTFKSGGGGIVFWKITRALTPQGVDIGACDVQTQIALRPA